MFPPDVGPMVTTVMPSHAGVAWMKFLDESFFTQTDLPLKKTDLISAALSLRNHFWRWETMNDQSVLEIFKEVTAEFIEDTMETYGVYDLENIFQNIEDACDITGQHYHYDFDTYYYAEKLKEKLPSEKTVEVVDTYMLVDRGILPAAWLNTDRDFFEFIVVDGLYYHMYQYEYEGPSHTPLTMRCFEAQSSQLLWGMTEDPSYCLSQFIEYSNIYFATEAKRGGFARTPAMTCKCGVVVPARGPTDRELFAEIRPSPNMGPLDPIDCDFVEPVR